MRTIAFGSCAFRIRARAVGIPRRLTALAREH